MASVGSLETQPDLAPTNTSSSNISKLIDKFIVFFSEDSWRWDHLDNYEFMYFIIYGAIISIICSIVLSSIPFPLNLVISFLILDKLTINCACHKSVKDIFDKLKLLKKSFCEKFKTTSCNIFLNNLNGNITKKSRSEPKFSQAEKALQRECLYKLAIETIHEESLNLQLKEQLLKLGLKNYRFFPIHHTDYQDDNFLGISIRISNANKVSLDEKNDFYAEIRAEIKNDNYHEKVQWNLGILSIRIIRADNWDVVEIIKLNGMG